MYFLKRHHSQSYFLANVHYIIVLCVVYTQLLLSHLRRPPTYFLTKKGKDRSMINGEIKKFRVRLFLLGQRKNTMPHNKPVCKNMHFYIAFASSGTNRFLFSTYHLFNLMTGPWFRFLALKYQFPLDKNFLLSTAWIF